jgi:hypothetical protein
MIKTNQAYISKLALQRVGNKHRNEICYFTDNLLRIDKEEENLLKRFFLSSLRSNDEVLKFNHHINLDYNVVYGLSKKVFSEEMDFIDFSKEIVQHLYEKSNHSQIKTGEVFTAFFEHTIFDDITTPAIGIFKVERKLDYLHFGADEDDEMYFEVRKGTKPQKIDKGCLIFNTHEDDGYRVIIFDNNNYDAVYWKNSFLDLEYQVNESYQTKHHVDLMVKFSESLVEENNSFTQKEFINHGIRMFQENEIMNDEVIRESLLEPFEVTEEFEKFKEVFIEDNKIELQNQFFVEENALKKIQKKIKNEIRLDTKIQIKMDLNEADQVIDNIEKGFDEDKGMHFYKVYFNEEE